MTVRQENLFQSEYSKSYMHHPVCTLHCISTYLIMWMLLGGSLFLPLESLWPVTVAAVTMMGDGVIRQWCKATHVIFLSAVCGRRRMRRITIRSLKKFAKEVLGMEGRERSTREKISVGLRSEEDYGVITKTSSIAINRALTSRAIGWAIKGSTVLMYKLK